MGNVAVRIENIGKQYRIGAKQQAYKTLRDSVVNLAKEPFRRFKRLSGALGPEEEMMWALQGINLEVQQGDVVGLVGHNGAGKSTLLKILSRITEPTVGRIEVFGRIGSLLEVGTGFHPELTGRENVYLNGAILGMRKSEINAKFDAIVSFAEMEKFLDTPVKRYSSGMQVRLAFAVAAHLEPEILLVDEVLAVGDVAFQKKCLGKMDDISKEGRTIIFVSHNMGAVTSLCQKGVLLDHGKVELTGSSAEAVSAYLSKSESAMKPVDGKVELGARHPGRRKKFDQRIRLLSCTLADESNEPTDFFSPGKPMTVSVEFEIDASTQNQNLVFAFAISDVLGKRVSYMSNEIVECEIKRAGAGGNVSCRINRLVLTPGRYFLTILCRVGAQWSDAVYDAVLFDVIGSDFYASGRMPPEGGSGNLLLDYTWSG